MIWGKRKFPNYVDPSAELANMKQNEDIILKRWWTVTWEKIKLNFKAFLAKDIYISSSTKLTETNEDFRRLRDAYFESVEKKLSVNLLMGKEEMTEFYESKYGSLLIVAPGKS